MRSAAVNKLMGNPHSRVAGCHLLISIALAEEIVMKNDRLGENI